MVFAGTEIKQLALKYAAVAVVDRVQQMPPLWHEKPVGASLKYKNPPATGSTNTLFAKKCCV